MFVPLTATFSLFEKAQNRITIAECFAPIVLLYHGCISFMIVQPELAYAVLHSFVFVFVFEFVFLFVACAAYEQCACVLTLEIYF